MKNVLFIILLSSISIASCDSSDVKKHQPVDDIIGLHVLSEYSDTHIFITKTPTPNNIKKTIRSLNWVSGFHQVIVVSSPGISMEVGGSLNPKDGLSSVYRDKKNKIYRVTKVPPTTVKEMERILISFHLGDNKWENMYDYELFPY